MELRFDFATDDRTTGFRLDRMELYNWGTYHEKIVTLEMNGANALLTGDIGSGKSTLVDALTTLLVPHQKITYNKAAGAESKERTLLSYVLGEYKTAQDEHFGNARPVALRDSSHFTVLLTRFYNTGYDEFVILAQFFHIVNRQVQKFFVVSQNELSIQKDFFDFQDIRTLKKRLRTTPFTQVYDNFKEYAKHFSRIMGLRNEQALNLFYQTVSLKSIGNLTQFIREHMLESSNIDTKITELCRNFSELNQTYMLVLRAKEQIERLKPIVSDGKKHRTLTEEKRLYEKISEYLAPYFAGYKKRLLDTKIDALEIELAKAFSRQKEIEQQEERLNDDLHTLKDELKQNGGERLAQIKQEIITLTREQEKRKETNRRYNNLVKSLGHAAVSNEHAFLKMRERCDREYRHIEEEKRELQNQLMLETHTQHQYDEQSKKLLYEIDYLRTHRSNIPQHISKMRDTMAKALDLEREVLPFAGELLRVTDNRWEGAIERVLHAFSLSLLVDEPYYEAVSAYVEHTDLQGKLVYLKVDSDKSYTGYAPNTPDSLLNKIEVKADTPFYDLLHMLLFERFDIPCVETLTEFRRYKRALTIHGQVKSSLSRHEKDDRYDINDKRHWTLGWDNAVKLATLEEEHLRLNEKKQQLQRHIDNTQTALASLQKRRDTLRDLLQYEHFEPIDWYGTARAIESLREEQHTLEKSSDTIRTLQALIDQKEEARHQLRHALQELIDTTGRMRQQKEDREEERNEAIRLCEEKSPEANLLEKITALHHELIDTNLTLNTIDKSLRILQEETGRRKQNVQKRIDRLTPKLIAAMQAFITEYPQVTKEFDADIEALFEYEKLLKALQKDNLPKWQKKFKDLFREKTIIDIVNLQADLEYNANLIKEKIETINLSLRDIEYSEGTYIELLAQKSAHTEIKQFKQDLKNITQGSITEEMAYDETKFNALKEMIDRFNGRENHAEVDRRWRKTVTDVRNWFDFSARERFISDGETKEFYASSGGKSGGQKEKLAYTVLASSLAYQFGVEYNAVQSRSFRFVMIDEAFGRGSDESTRYALELFEKLKLQLLVITPKQKIHVIEPYVSSVHFVHNQEGSDSSLLSMKIETYRQKKHA